MMDTILNFIMCEAENEKLFICGNCLGFGVTHPYFAPRAETQCKVCFGYGTVYDETKAIKMTD